MRKLFLIAMIFAIALVAVNAVSAWHCTDTDANRPRWNSTTRTYGLWGDNSALGGTTAGWLDKGVTKPQGCTGSQGSYNCQDFCDGTTLKEFSCTDRPRHLGETIISWNSHENSAVCGYQEVPEFGVVAATVAMIGALAVFVMSRKRL